MEANDTRAQAILQDLQRAVRAQVEFVLALRDIESELGQDADGLDEYVQGLAFNIDQPRDVRERITLKQAQECITHCFKQEEEN